MSQYILLFKNFNIQIKLPFQLQKMELTPTKVLNSLNVEKKTIGSIINNNYVTVSCRLKPLLQNEERSKIDVNKIGRTITINQPTKSISKTYGFDYIFDQCTEQHKFVNYICDPLIEFLKSGGDTGLIFSYGITNSGKTYSILGTPESPGILLNLIKKLGQQFKNDPIKIVACELYKDQFYSLKNKGEKLNPRQFRGTYSLQDCEFEIINENNMEELFSSYLHNRAVSSTISNSHSSRSHAIFKIQTSRYKIGIVDLAGSERYSKNQENNDIKQTIFINSSLLTLKKCIKALQQRSIVAQKVLVPYRQSKLTQSLIEYFSPISKINIIVNLNQAREFLQQNLMVMDYTSKAKNISSNANSDFALIIKNSHKKYQELKNSVKATKSHKSILKMGHEEFIITEQMLSDEQTSDLIEKQIINNERNKLLQKKIQSRFFQQIYEDSQKFIHYLQIDENIRKHQQQQKLQGLKRINLAKTQKKINENDNYNQLMEIQMSSKIVQNPKKVGVLQYGVNTIIEDNQDKIQESARKILAMKSIVKKRIFEVLEQQKRKNLKNAETCFSTNRKNIFMQNLNEGEDKISYLNAGVLQIDKNNKRQFSTPSKKRQFDNEEQMQDELEEECINFLQKSIKKSVMILGSGIKMFQNGFNAISNLAIRTDKKRTQKNILIENQNQLKKKKLKLNFQSSNIFESIFPFKKTTFNAEAITDIIWEQINLKSECQQKIQMNDTQVNNIPENTDVYIQVDLNSFQPQIDEKIIEAISLSIKQQKENNKEKKHRKNRKNKELETLQKIAFKQFSTHKNKRNEISQFKKKKQFPSYSAQKSSNKRYIAKNTRAAHRNKQLKIREMSERFQ